MPQITYDNKDSNLPSGSPQRQWRDIDANEVKNVVNQKTDVGHTHSIGDVTDLSSELNGKAPTVHTHTISQVTDLQTELNGKAKQVAINSQSGTSYTLVLSDDEKIIVSDNANAVTITVPANSSVAFRIGAVINVVQKGAGVVSVTGATGVTVNGTSAGSVSISDRWQGVSLLKIDTNEWIVSGAI